MTTYSNLNVLTNNAKVNQIILDYYAPVSRLANSVFNSTYAFLGREDPWPYASDGVTEIPTQPTQDQKYLKNVFKNMFAVKQVNTSNIRPVIQRIDWANNTNYFAYSDKVDLTAKDSTGVLYNNFYIKNRYDQVFKCLANNNGGLSTQEPYFQPGSYGTNNIYQGTDYYKWKYMYTIDAGSKKNFMDANWMPLPTTFNTPQPYTTSAGCGDIEAINITNGGTGYDAVNNYIVVTVTGDGSGVVANVTPSQIVNGVIKDVVIKSGYNGSNYTYADVSIVAYTSSNLAFISTKSSNATAIAPVSPVGGHAYDPISELGCSNIMYQVEFNGTENGILPVDGVNYRQVGLLVQPQMIGSNNSAVLANGSIYNISTQLALSSGAGNIYSSDELVQQFDNNNNVIFNGTVLSFNTTTNVLQLINTKGSPAVGQPINGYISGASRTVLSNTSPTLIPYSGYITYIENRAGVQRSSDGIEQFRFVLGY
jgi:hypothetical protein